MNRLTKIFLTLLSVTLVLVFSYPTVAKWGKTEKGKEALAIEISVAGRPPLTVPVRSEKKVALLPLTGAKASAIKVVPRAEGGSIKFDVLAVLDNLPEKLTCENLKQLRTEFVTSRTGLAGDTIRIADLEKFGVEPLNVRVITAVPQLCPDGCCCCGSTSCCPNPGHCMDCGSCGRCCNGNN